MGNGLDNASIFVLMNGVYNMFVMCVMCLYAWCDTPKPGGLVDQRQPAKTCVSHIMRPIHE